jgi:hypothetical protein
VQAEEIELRTRKGREEVKSKSNDKRLLCTIEAY